MPSNIFFKVVISISSILFPISVIAATAPTNFSEFVGLVLDLISTLFVVLISLMVIAMIWGIVNGWIIHGSESEGVEQGKHVLLAGIIGFVVVVSIWAILALVRASFFSS